MTGVCAAAAAMWPVTSVLVSLSDVTVAKASSSTAVAAYSIANDGKVRNQDSTVLGAWLGGAGGVVSDYQVMATLVSGSLTTGNTGNWLSCSSTNTWAIANSARNNSVISARLTVQIRRVSDSAVLATAAITISAESDNFN